MKKIFIFIFLCFYSFYTHSHDTRSIEKLASLSPETLVHNVLQRLYLIERLSDPIEAILSAHYDQNNLCNQLHEITSFCTFSHPTIESEIGTIAKHGTLDPLKKIWHRFASYQAINDTLLTEELIKAIYIVAQQICRPPAHAKQHESPDNIEQLLDAIDVCIEQIRNKKNKNENHKPVQTDYLNDIHLNVHAENIILRYYCIQRTYKAKKIIKKYRSLEHQKNSKLKKIIDTFERYKHIRDHEFTHQYVRIILNECQKIHTKSWHSRHIIIENPDEASLEQLLNAIDMIIEELPPLLEKYEFTNSEISWKEWLKKYWWAPAVIGATIGFKIWFSMQTQQA